MNSKNIAKEGRLAVATKEKPIGHSYERPSIRKRVIGKTNQKSTGEPL